MQWSSSRQLGISSKLSIKSEAEIMYKSLIFNHRNN